MDNKNFAQITKYYSTSFYWAALLFPRNIRSDIYALYAFLRYSDELADTIKDMSLFQNFKNKTLSSLDSGKKTGDTFIDAYIKLHQKYSFDQKWVSDFFKTLGEDIEDKINIKTYKDLEKYIYGVADIVGLMMAKIMGLSDSSAAYARALGRAMQLINIIRDIKEDYLMNRIYIPEEDIKKFGLGHIYPLHENFDKTKFEKLIRFELERAIKILQESKQGFKIIPKTYRKPIILSAALYLALAKKIYKNPLKIWDEKIRLTKLRFLIIYLRNMLYAI